MLVSVYYARLKVLLIQTKIVLFISVDVYILEVLQIKSYNFFFIFYVFIFIF